MRHRVARRLDFNSQHGAGWSVYPWRLRDDALVIGCGEVGDTDGGECAGSVACLDRDDVRHAGQRCAFGVERLRWD